VRTAGERRSAPRLQHAPPDLVQLDRLEQRPEIALAEALVALALDDLEEDRADLVLGEYLQQQALASPASLAAPTARLLAALQALPPSLGEAAAIEGASRWTYFRRIQFPLLMPTTLFVLVNATINSFKLVDHLFILTKGGPDNASSLLLYYIYQVAFSFFDTGYAATLTVVLLVLLALLAVVQFLLIEKRVHYR
jgi:ABC-type arginine/histidine transport system permease subunit